MNRNVHITPFEELSLLTEHTTRNEKILMHQNASITNRTGTGLSEV